MSIVRYLLTGVVFFFFVGCSVFDYHPYDGDINGEVGINAKNIARIEQACAGKDTVRFVWMGDTQGMYNATEKFVASVNSLGTVNFVMHGGDISDYGVTQEFEWMRDILSRLTVPYVVLIGNHDGLGSGRDVFIEMFGQPNFSFLAGKVKFVCLETNTIGVYYSIPIPDFTFLKEQLKEQRDGHEATIVAMHSPPFNDEFNNNVAHVFQRFITEFPQLQFCLYAHLHRFLEVDLFDDGVIYYGCDSVDQYRYLVFTVTKNSYSYEMVTF